MDRSAQNSTEVSNDSPNGFSNERFSRITAYSGLIVTIAIVIIALVRLYFIDNFLLTHIYPPYVRAQLNDQQRRSFFNHHVAAAIKIILIIVAVYPFVAILGGFKPPQAPFAPGSSTTLGDVMIVVSQIFVAMYVFELMYRDKISYVSCAHHIGAMIICQVSVALSIQSGRSREPANELLLAFVWGAFDVLAELWPHIAMILYRTHASRPRFLYRLFVGVIWLELFSTTLETGIVMWLFGANWKLWGKGLKVITPMLHVLFTVAQLWGSYVLWQLARAQRDRIQAKEGEGKREVESV